MVAAAPGGQAHRHAFGTAGRPLKAHDLLLLVIATGVQCLQLHDLLATALRVGDPHERAEVLRTLTHIVAPTSKLPALLESALNLPDAGKRGEILRAMSQALAYNEQPEQMLTLAMQIGDPAKRLEVLRVAIQVLVQAGEFFRLCRPAQQNAHLPNAEMLKVLTQVLAQQGRHDMLLSAVLQLGEGRAQAVLPCHAEH